MGKRGGDSRILYCFEYIKANRESGRNTADVC